ncbi:MAG: glycosyltransferase [Candidatus Hydrothermae bacterium]|nr:glycosyltransferase [Candidatus Hydrothermae bacterium]
MTRPLVSILINNHNYAAFLEEAIESALAQTYRPVEVIVVDDGSEDGSREILARYQRKGDITVILKENEGQASAFNTGFERAQGEILCLLDSDDRFKPHKVEKVVEQFQRYPEAGWLSHPLAYIWEGSTGEGMLPSVNVSYADYPSVADIPSMLRQGRRPHFDFAPTSGLVFRRNVIRQVLPVAPVGLPVGADTYLKFSASVVAPVIFYPEPLAEQRIHEHNAYTFRRITRERARLEANIYMEIIQTMVQRFPESHKWMFGHARFQSARVMERLGMSAFREISARYAEIFQMPPVFFQLQALARYLVGKMRRERLG